MTAISDHPLLAGVMRQSPEEQPVDLLRKAGFPPRLLSLLESRGLSDFSLEAAFRAPPSRSRIAPSPWGTGCDLGPLEDALALATRVGDELGLPASEIALALPAPTSRPYLGRGAKTPVPVRQSLPRECVAADLLVTDAESAAALAPGWRRDPCGRRRGGDRRHRQRACVGSRVLKAARPSFTLALADARTRMRISPHSSVRSEASTPSHCTTRKPRSRPLSCWRWDSRSPASTVQRSALHDGLRSSATPLCVEGRKQRCRAFGTPIASSSACSCSRCPRSSRPFQAASASPPCS